MKHYLKEKARGCVCLTALDTGQVEIRIRSLARDADGNALPDDVRARPLTDLESDVVSLKEMRAVLDARIADAEALVADAGPLAVEAEVMKAAKEETEALRVAKEEVAAMEAATSKPAP